MVRRLKVNCVPLESCNVIVINLIKYNIVINQFDIANCVIDLLENENTYSVIICNYCISVSVKIQSVIEKM